MSALKIFPAILIVVLATSCSKDLFRADAASSCQSPISFAPAHPMKDSIQVILDKYIKRGVPGIQVMLKNDKGWLHVTAGFSNIHTRDTFRACTPGWLFSITKTYTAVLVLKLWEQGKIDLAGKIGDYLPSHILQNITGYEKITVTQLLNHSSGIINLTDLPQFMVEQFNAPLKQPGELQRLSMVKGKPAQFEPGTDFQYSNTNYLLLQLLLEEVTGKDYGSLLSSLITVPLQLEQTYYGLSQEMTEQMGFPAAYFDRHANNQLENVTRWNNAVANGSTGYGGIAATPDNVIRFYEALVNGKVLTAPALRMMQQWFRGKVSGQPDYGLGLEYFQFDRLLGPPQFGHEGDGIGSSTQVMFVPATGTTAFITCNAGRKLFGPYLFHITDLKNELSRYLASTR